MMFDLYGSNSGFYPTANKLPGQNASLVEVSGGQIAIVGDFNLFMLDDVDRRFLDAIVDAVRVHREAKPNKPVEVAEPLPIASYPPGPAEGDCIICGEPGGLNLCVQHFSELIVGDPRLLLHIEPTSQEPTPEAK